MYIIEMVTYNIKNNIAEKDFLFLSYKFENLLKEKSKGFIKRSLTRDFFTKKCIELIWWSSIEDAKNALNKMPSYKEFEDFSSILDESTSEIIYLKKIEK